LCKEKGARVCAYCTFACVTLFLLYCFFPFLLCIRLSSHFSAHDFVLSLLLVSTCLCVCLCPGGHLLPAYAMHELSRCAHICVPVSRRPSAALNHLRMFSFCPYPHVLMCACSLNLTAQPAAYVGGKGQHSTVKPTPKPPTPTELEELALHDCPPEQFLLTCVANLSEGACAAVLEALLDGCEKAVRAFISLPFFFGGGGKVLSDFPLHIMFEYCSH